jgi:hypothetical protein
MSNTFAVVTDIAEIARLNKRLGQHLASSFRVKRTREITYPSGHHTGTVYFEGPSGTAVRAWSPDKGPDKLINFLLSGDPDASTWMQIDVQMNFPAATYNRRMAGAFVVDQTGDVFVAHRGKLTKGNAGLPKAKVFREFSRKMAVAEDSGKTSRVILISALDDPHLADRLWDFAVEAREVATRIAEEQDDGELDLQDDGDEGSGAGTSRDDKRSKDPIFQLRDYFDEYSGEGSSKGHGGGRRIVEHGDVVTALEATLRSRGRSQKAQAIDLAIVARDAVDLYEVKTSAGTTDVYTGVGQLLIHGECIRELLNLPVRRHLVLPAEPRAGHGKHINKKGGMRIVTYGKNGNAYEFFGL